MTTATAPTRVIDWDHFSALEDARAEARSSFEAGYSLTGARERLRAALTAERQRGELLTTISTLQASLDEAVARHAEAAGQLQARLAGDDLSTSERLSLRVELESLNDALEQEATGLRRQIAAAEAEAHVLAVRASAKQAIENAFVNAGESGERIRILQRAEELIESGVLFATRRKAADADAALAAERRRRESGERPRFDTEELEARARFWGGVAGAISGACRSYRDEIEQIRTRRLRELYRGIED